MLDVALLLAAAVLASTVVAALASSPWILMGIRSARKDPARAKVRAIPWAIVAGFGSAILIALIGFVWAAGIGDESAGEIAEAIFLGGLPLGFVLGAAITFVVVAWRGSKPVVADAA